eukprot:TRINITY_DN2474_c0_g3_i1.p1 TRINITY_DN2474_c0_g3~~TRINITY_DN2474_c0_g3_i1.p1  ORF type:complete len:406 (-),score=77.19 TRINITY_DN2474_c0_g3_i1:78-1295(-)
MEMNPNYKEEKLSDLGDPIPPPPEVKSLSITFKSKLYWYFLILGYGSAVPWNLILVGLTFFKVHYKALRPEFIFPLIFFAPAIGTKILLITHGNYFPVRAKLIGCFALLSLFSYILILFSKCIADEAASFTLVLIIIFILGMAYEIVQSTINNLAITIGSGSLLKPVVTGKRITGIVMGALMLLCLLLGYDEKHLFPSAMLFFIVGTFTIIGVTFVAYLTLEDPIIIEVIKQPLEAKFLSQTFDQASTILKGHGKDILLTLALTFAVFPGVLIGKLTYSHWQIPVALLLFSFSDALGRILAHFFKVLSSDWVSYMSFLRLLVVGFVCCVYFIKHSVFSKPGFTIANLIVLGFSNGLIINLALRYELDDSYDEEKEDVLVTLNLFSSIGIVVGTLVAQFVFYFIKV